jgi:transcriptional regulator with XRE-family HTH domain
MSDHTAEEAALHCFRTNVRTLRLAAGLSQKKASERAHMHPRHWQKIEAGQIKGTLLTLARLARVLKVDAAVLLCDPERQAR